MTYYKVKLNYDPFQNQYNNKLMEGSPLVTDGSCEYIE